MWESGSGVTSAHCSVCDTWGWCPPPLEGSKHVLSAPCPNKIITSVSVIRKAPAFKGFLCQNPNLLSLCHIKWVQSPTGSECHICVQGPHLTLPTGSSGPLWCLFSHLSNRALSSRSYRCPSVFSEFTLPIMLKITPRFHAAQIFLLGRSWLPPLATSVPQACPLCGQVRELSVQSQRSIKVFIWTQLSEAKQVEQFSFCY